MKAIKCPDCGAKIDLQPYFAGYGRQGGTARAANQTAEQRSAIARAGANARNALRPKKEKAKRKDTRVDVERLRQRQDLPQPAPGDE